MYLFIYLLRKPLIFSSSTSLHPCVSICHYKDLDKVWPPAPIPSHLQKMSNPVTTMLVRLIQFVQPKITNPNLPQGDF